jgi:hypothetical protein
LSNLILMTAQQSGAARVRQVSVRSTFAFLHAVLQ